MFFNRDGEGESTSPSHHTGSLKGCSTLEDSKERAEGWNVSRREGGHQEDSRAEVQRPRNMEGLMRYVMSCYDNDMSCYDNDMSCYDNDMSCYDNDMACYDNDVMLR